MFAVVILSLGHALVNCAALLLRGASPVSPGERQLVELLLTTPFAFVLSGGVAAYARGAGMLAFVKGAFSPGSTS